MKQRFIYFTALFLLAACGNQTPQEKEAFEDVLEVVENLPELLEEEEIVAEENTDKMKGSLKLHTDKKDITVSTWLARRSSTTFMDINFSLQACSDGDCTKKMLVSVSGPDIHNQALPFTLSASPFEEYNAKITFVDADKTEYYTQEGEFELTALSENHFTLSFNGDIFEGIGMAGGKIPATFDIDFEFNFISTDIREK